MRIIPLVAFLVLIQRPDILMIDYTVNLFSSPFLLLGRFLKTKTKVVMDIRTLPVIPETFHREIKTFHLSLKVARRTCQGLTFITPAMRDYCLERVSLKQKKYKVWSSGFAENLFDPQRCDKVQKDGFELFYHGGISLSRGIGNLIRSVSILRQKGYPVTLKLVGALNGGPVIKALIKQFDLEKSCRIFEPLPYEDIPGLIANADLPVIPFPHFRGWEVSSPIKLMEYMAMGKAMVLTDIRAHRDVVGQSSFVFYARSDDPEDLSEAIGKAYINRENLDQLGKKARELALQKYTWGHQADSLADFLESLT
jgi:glycosyltransferase involved in cell wall biosynthesis